MSPFPEQGSGKRGQKDIKGQEMGAISKKNMMKVLIVDDDEALACLIKEMIDRMDLSCEDGREWRGGVSGEKRPRNGNGYAES